MRRKHLVLISLAGLACSVALILRKGRQKARIDDWPVNLAHRGASSLAPENTIEAFRIALEAGAGGLALEVHMTRDGDIVAINIDIKACSSGIEAAVLGVLREADAFGRVLVVSTPHATVKRFREISGGHISTGASRWETGIFYLLSRLHLEWLARPGYDALQVPPVHRGIPLVTPRFIAAAHSRGVRVDVWTINQVAEMRRLLDHGVDMLMTDRPEALEGLLAERR